jgi:hypothetical protein
MSGTIFTVRPAMGANLMVGDELLPAVEFPSNVHLIRLRKKRQYHICGFIDGDGAIDLLRRPTPLPALTIAKVSELSGYATTLPIESLPVAAHGE